jgi:NAD(P)-dependent dehydrogenase (short-subunit alcohol dehydrogenase family)
MADWERAPGFDLSGKRAVVVGLANPAGAGIAQALAEAGADVALAATSMDGDEVMAARRASKAIADLGRKTMYQAWDVVLPKNVQVSYRQLVKEFGAPSILVYNGDHMIAKPFDKVTDTEFARMQAVNTNGALYSARSFLHDLPEGEPGRIIIVSNVFAERGVENLAAYTVSRAGANALVTGLSQEYGGRNVTVNAIATGWMEWTEGRGPDDINENKLMRFIPMRRFGGASELGGLAVLLASDASGYINGQVLHIDGGIMTHL